MSHCLFQCPCLDSIQISLLMSFWVWCFFAMRMRVGKIKCGPNSPEVQAPSVCETNGALLRLCFEQVSQICNSRNIPSWDSVVTAEIVMQGHVCAVPCCATPEHSWGWGVWAAFTLQQCHSCVLCRAWGSATQGQHVQASRLPSGLGI